VPASSGLTSGCANAPSVAKGKVTAFRDAAVAMGHLRQAEHRINVPDSPHCRLCGSATKERYEFAPYTLLVCNACGLGQLDPLPAADALEQLYSSSAYFENQDGAGYADYAQHADEFAMTFRAKMQRLLRYGPVHDLLEIGCGPGYLLEAAKHAGVPRAVGVDRNPWAIEQARRSGHSAYIGSIDVVPPNDRFDAVAMLDLLEHIPEPMPFLAQVRQRLRPNGRLLIMTPNLESLLARISGRRWVSFKIPEHLHYFTPRSLARLLDANGFRVLYSRGTGQYVSVEFFLDRLGRIAPRLRRLIEPPARRLHLLQRVIYVTNGSIDVVAQVRD
jgi:SAM-dependent methyltransferase